MRHLALTTRPGIRRSPRRALFRHARHHQPDVRIAARQGQTPGTHPARRRAGYSLIQLLIALVLVALLMRLGASGLRSLNTQQQGERLVRAVLWEATVARSSAVRYSMPLALVADKVNKRLILRDAFGYVYRMVEYGKGSDQMADSLSVTTAGDSLTFSGRGFCLNCDPAGTTAIHIRTRGRTYQMNVNALGRTTLLGLPNS